MKSMLLLVGLTTSCCIAQDSGKFEVRVAGMDSAAPVAQWLAKQMNASKPFEAVGPNDPSKVVILISCMTRTKDEPFACLYVEHYNGATFKTFMGAGLQIGVTADEVATNFLGSIAQDIVERYESTGKDNVRQAFESCLFFTDTKCNVPEVLQKELGAKELTLGRYMMKSSGQEKAPGDQSGGSSRFRCTFLPCGRADRACRSG